jgi:hypothetical protein
MSLPQYLSHLSPTHLTLFYLYEAVTATATPELHFSNNDAGLLTFDHLWSKIKRRKGEREEREEHGF